VPFRRRWFVATDARNFVTVQVINIGSGSSGNALLVRDGATSLLVDCGIGPRIIESVLRANGTSWANLSGMVLTHEHADHVKSLPAALRKGVRIVCTPGTAHGARIPEGGFESIDQGAFSFSQHVSIQPLTVSHDATEPCGFNITLGSTNICVITDTGEALDHFIAPIQSADLLILESNHDERMLWRGPYPHHLKVRVASAKGHLSNHAAGELLRTALDGGNRSQTIWLGHLSETNNRPEIALSTVRDRLGPVADSVRLTALTRNGGQRWQSDQQLGRQLSLFDAL
jgi:phosphoribosyl 1,2-cyclic phosphodiesterase